MPSNVANGANLLLTQHPVEIDARIREWLPHLAGLRVLDVGCGQGSLGLLIRQAAGGLDAYVVGAEIWKPHVDFVRRFNLYDEVWEGDVTSRAEIGEFDIVLACEVLEHFERSRAEELLRRLEASTRRRIIVSTPNGSDLRAQMGENAAEAHLSAWNVADFRSRGYEVRGVGSRLRRSDRQNHLTMLAWHLCMPLAGRLPVIAGNIVAVRGS